MIYAQVNATTREVEAVVEMREPIATPPATEEWVPVADFSAIGKYYVGGQFQVQKP